MALLVCLSSCSPRCRDASMAGWRSNRSRSWRDSRASFHFSIHASPKTGLICSGARINASSTAFPFGPAFFTRVTIIGCPSLFSLLMVALAISAPRWGISACFKSSSLPAMASSIGISRPSNFTVAIASLSFLSKERHLFNWAVIFLWRTFVLRRRSPACRGTGCRWQHFLLGRWCRLDHGCLLLRDRLTGSSGCICLVCLCIAFRRCLRRLLLASCLFEFLAHGLLPPRKIGHKICLQCDELR